MFKILGRARELERQGREIVHFEIGDPDFDTPDNIVEAACDALHRGDTHYASSRGLFDFRVAAAETTEISRGFKPDIGQVLPTPGANIVIYYAVRCLVDPGDDVILSDPCFPTYRSAVEFCGVNPVYVPLREENGFRMQAEDLRAAMTDRTRLIVINSPHNPCGSVMTREELKAIYDVAEEHDVYLLSDEVYSRMIYGSRDSFWSVAQQDGCLERTILLNGFSKAFAMTGWRLGCVIGPHEVVDKMALMLETTSSCVAPFIQRAAIEAMRGPQDQARSMSKEYRLRRELLVEGLRELPGVTCVTPGGAFYAFPNIRGTGLTDDAFAELMLEEAGVALLPGSNFGAAGEGFVRLCYTTSRDTIARGLDLMKACLERRRL